MAVAPYIKPLQVTGGTFYSFTTAAEDLALTFNNDNTKFQFSKYALLNLPLFATPAHNENDLQLLAVGESLAVGGPPQTTGGADMNINFGNSFQDYCLNLEAMLISQPTYDRTVLHSVSERVFFKWLKEMGGIRYQSASAVEAVPGGLFRENPTTTTGAVQYQQVVQYLGSIDVVNNVQNNVNAYTEIYIHVPSNDGSTPLILFDSVQDANYAHGMVIQNLPTDPLNADYIYGRHWDDILPTPLSNLAIFDQGPVGNPISNYWNGTSWVPQNWFGILTGPNAYFTDDNGSGDFNDPTTDLYQKIFGSPVEIITYYRSRLDGVGLDFNPTDYYPIVTNPSITTIDQFNSTVDAQPFEFNCILVYYDKFDPNNPSNTATNLYGVMFLEDIQQEGTEQGIPPFAKYIPNVITNINGNSYGFKINLKFDTSVDNVGTEQAINDYSSFSLSMFIDAMNTLQNSADILNDKSAQIDALVGQVNAIQDNLINLTQWSELDLRITTVEDSLAASQALLANSTAVMDLIAKNANDIAALAQGQTSIAVSYNIDAVKQGDGIVVDRTVPNQVTIDNVNQGFNIQSAVPYQGNVIAGATIAVQKFNNYFRHYASGLNQIASTDITIQMDDTLIRWQFGQTLRLSFQDIIELGGNSLIILTDATNRLGGGPYGVTIATIPSSAFTSAGFTPIFDITCVDTTTLTFIVDQIK